MAAIVMRMSNLLFLALAVYLAAQLLPAAVAFMESAAAIQTYAVRSLGAR